MVELTGRWQFYQNAVSRERERVSIHVIFNDSHIPLLRPLKEQGVAFWPRGTVEEGLVFGQERVDPERRSPAAITLYNKKSFKIGMELSSKYFKTGKASAPPTALVPIKLTWDAHKKEFRLPPINLEELTSRARTWKTRVHKKKQTATDPAPAPAPAAASGSVVAAPKPSSNPIEQLRAHLRGLNDLAAKLGVELTAENGKVRAILNFE